MDKICPIRSIVNKTCCTSDCAFFDNDEKNCKLVMLFDFAISELKDEKEAIEACASLGVMENE